MPEWTLTINTLLALIRGTKALQKEVGERTLMKILAAQTQESAELPAAHPAFPESWRGRTMVCPFLPLPGLPRCSGAAPAGVCLPGSSAWPQPQPWLCSTPARHPPLNPACLPSAFIFSLQNGDVGISQPCSVSPSRQQATDQGFLCPRKSHRGVCCAVIRPCP